MKTIQCANVLFEYDGPQVIEARDATGGCYVGVLGPSGEQYLIVPVSPERFRQFCNGAIDLRSICLEAGQDTWFLASGELESLSLMRQTTPIDGSQFLPKSGFFLDSSDEHVSEATIPVRLPLITARAVEDLASTKGVDSAELIREWVHERLRAG